MTHKQKMIDHFLWLRSMPGAVDYARDALERYVAQPDCLIPDLDKLVKAEWKALNESQASTKPGDR